MLLKEKNYTNIQEYINKFVKNIYKYNFYELVIKIHKLQIKTSIAYHKKENMDYYHEIKELFQKGAILNSYSENSELNNPKSNMNIFHYFRKKLIEGNSLIDEYLKPAKRRWELNKIGISTKTDIIDAINILTDVIEKKILSLNNNNESFTLLIVPRHALCFNYYRSLQTGCFNFILFDPNFGFYKFEQKDQKIVPNSFIAFLSNILCFYCLNEDGYEKKTNFVDFYDFN